jgi:tetratricopeptide (TPR) repeat protein
MLTARDRFERCIALCRQHGFGRIEVARLPMAAITRFYAGEIAAAYADALAAVAAAERVGHQRAAVIGCHIVFFAAMSRSDLDAARHYVGKAIDLSRQLGARRFEAEGLWFLADLQLAEGHREDAVAVVRQALAISRATGMAFLGPAILGGLARATTDAAERRAALAEGEQLLAAGSVSHNHIWFYQEAIETALEQRDWQEAGRYADALADYTRKEPLPYVDCFVARTKALVAFGRGQRDGALRGALQDARAGAAALGWQSLLPELDRALAAAGSAPSA